MDPTVSRTAPRISWDSVDRYLSGETTPPEGELVRARLEKLPELEGLLHNPRSYLDSAHGGAPSGDAGWEALQARIAGAEHPGAESARQPWGRALWRSGIGTAFVGIVAIAGWLIGRAQPAQMTPVSMTTYSTSSGERGVIDLPDGTRVVLSVASRIRIPTNFSAANRTVHLTGEALFTVAHTERAPFTVVAGPSTTRVLGTTFVVRHYEGDTSATVVVRDGKVAVQSTVLTAAQQVVVGWRGIGAVRSADSTGLSVETGVLTLDNVALKDAIPALNRWYGADVRFGDPGLASRRITSTFPAGAIGELASILGYTFEDIGVVRNGRVLTLYRR